MSILKKIMKGNMTQNVINVKPYPLTENSTKEITDFAYNRTKQFSNDIKHKYPGGMNVSLKLFFRDTESDKQASAAWKNIVTYDDILKKSN